MHMLVNDEVSAACLIGDHLFLPPLALPRAFEIFPFIGARYNTRLANSVKRSNHVIAPTLHPCPLRGLTEEMKLDYIPSNKSHDQRKRSLPMRQILVLLFVASLILCGY